VLSQQVRAVVRPDLGAQKTGNSTPWPPSSAPRASAVDDEPWAVADRHVAVTTLDDAR
jgi:hypothetical protein